jgi:hypothetical protein
MRTVRRSNPGFVTACVCAASGVAAAPAVADTPWSAPQTIGGTTSPGPGGLPVVSGPSASAQHLVALAGGGVAISVNTNLYILQQPAGKPTIVPPVGFTGLLSPSGVLGRLTPVGGGRTVNALVPAGGGVRALGTIGLGSTLSSASGRPGHSLVGSRSLSIPGGSVAASSGDAVLVSRCSKDCVRRDLAVVRAEPGGRWSSPRAITQPGTEVRGGALTTLAGGTIAVAYERNHAIYTRRLAPSGRLSPAQRVGTGIQADISIAGAGGQRVDVAWSWQRVDEGDAVSGFTAHVACSTSIGHFSGRSRTLSSIPVTGTGAYVGGPGLAMGRDAAGRLTLAWSAFAGGRFVVQTSNLSTSCGTAAQTIALPGADAVLGGLAVGATGRATVVLSAGVYGSDPAPASRGEAARGLLAAERPTHNGHFASPVQVSASDDDEVEPVVVIDQASGRSVLAWRNVATSIEYSSAP